MSSSYRQILRSSSIMGGSQALTYIIGLIRIKVVAVLLGPSGVGLVSLYGSTLGLLGTVTGLGIGSSGVREVVQAYSQNDSQQAARTVRTLRRACWATGLLGWLLAVALAQPISAWVLGSTEHAWAIAVLGVTLLIGTVSSGQLALLQGLRRIGDLARANVFGVLVSTCVSIGLYVWLGQAGIVPVLVASALVSLGFSYWFARRVEVQATDLSWAETIAGTKRLVGLGAAFMWSGLLTAGVDLLTRTVITRQLGLESAGIYQAAWALSGLFAGFILSAMGADFYPRLTAAIHDKAAAVRMVNEQTEVGILLAFPGLLGTLAFAPWAMEIFYTKSFVAGAELLPWFVLGVFGRVLSWPMGFIQLAAGASKWFFATETMFLGIQAGLIIWMVPAFGIVGAAYAFVATYALYTVGMYWVGGRLIGFYWSSRVVNLLLLVGVVLAFNIAINRISNNWICTVVSLLLVLGSLLLTAIGLFGKNQTVRSL